MKHYELFSTTADVGIRVWGEDCAALCTNGLSAFNELVFGNIKKKRSLASGSSHHFEYFGDSCENVMVNFLLELQYLTYEKRQWAPFVRVLQSGDHFLEAELFLLDWPGEPQLEIKSVTYHNLELREEEGRKRLDVVLDV